MLIDCFAQRLLNPFRGAMHTVKYDAAEAVTVDGRHWDIYVSNDALLKGLDHHAHPQVGDIHYGSWSVAEGLRRGRRRVGHDFRYMEAQGDALCEHLAALNDHIPFVFKDEFELWLLDRAAQPLALLHSVFAPDEIVLDVPPAWRAGYAAHDRFASEALGCDNAGDTLTRYINAHAGPVPVAQWFQRAEDGSGVGLVGIHLDHALIGRHLPRAAFPPLLLADIGHDAAHQHLIDDFHGWQAVWLLTLPALAHETRRRLETQARRQAAVVESQFRLYPQVINKDLIQAARVEARLRASQAADPRPANDLSVFYIDLNPCGNE